MSEVVNWGILGGSAFARKVMGPAIHEARGARLYGLATSSPEKAEGFRAFSPDLNLFESYDALIECPEIDAVYIPLPNTLHVEWSQRALEAGKHVLTEKPIAMAAPEIVALIEQRDATGLHCAEGFMIVHLPQWARVRALIAEGALGSLVHVAGAFSYNNPDPGNIRNRPEVGGGGIRDIGVYPYGAARWATGQEPERITGVKLRHENGVDTFAEVSADFPGFTFHAVTSTRLCADQWMRFHGTEGVLHVTTPFNANTAGDVTIVLTDAAGRVCTERFAAVRQYVNQVENFGATLRGAAPYPWTLEDARGTQAMIDMIFAATEA